MKRVFIVAFVLLNQPVLAQLDTSWLGTTTIDARDRLITSELDSLQQRSGTLGNVLRNESNLVVMPQSGSALSTLSIRGGSSEQSTLYWHGLRLNSNMNGTMDLNLIPTWFISSAEINSGQSTTLGSGAIAGTLNFKSDVSDSSVKARLRLEGGSFNDVSLAGQVSLVRSPKVVRSLAVLARSSENRYRIQDLSGDLAWLDHARLRTIGLLYSAKRQLKRLNPISSRLWIQSNERQIPAMLTESSSNRWQVDHNVRWQADWTTRTKTWGTIRFTGGVMGEQLLYRDSIAKLYTDYKSLNLTGLAHYYKRYKKTVHFVDLEVRNFQGVADTNYQGQRNEYALGTQFVRKTKKSIVSAGVRMVAFSDAPRLSFPAHISFQHRIKPSWLLHTKLHSNYRMPTFNSLYWTPGGNANLLPEQSVNSEWGGRLTKKNLKLSGTVFANAIYNLIQWLPGTEGYWVATQTESLTINRGVELSGSYALKTWVLQGNVNYTRSSDTSKYDLQRIYLPRLQHNFTATKRYKHWSFRYNHLWMGQRYTDVNNTETLPSFFVVNASIHYRFKRLSLGVEVNNMLNTYYSYFQYRPNPPRELRIHINYLIKRAK